MTKSKIPMRALSEARWILRPGGILLGFAITRYAGLIYGLTKGYVFDAEYLAMLRREVETGCGKTRDDHGIHH